VFAYLLAEFMRTWTPNGYRSAGWLTLDEDERYLSPPGGPTARAVFGFIRGAKTDPSDGEGTKVVLAPASSVVAPFPDEDRGRHVCVGADEQGV